MSVAEAYDPDSRWGRPFGWRPDPGQPNPYTISGYHRGQDIRKTDPTGSLSVVTDVVSLSAGRVSHLYTGKSTGREVVVDTGRQNGRYEIHCHNAYFPRVGLEVEPGGVLTRNATAKQQPGTAWSAPHDHFVISDSPDAAHSDRPVYDPRPFILAALAAPADSNARPFEEDFMATLTEDEKTALLSGVAELRARMGDSVLPNLTEIKALGYGLNEKLGWLLASAERDKAGDAEQLRILSTLAAALPTGAGAPAAVDLSPVLAAIAANQAAIDATPAAVRTELAKQLAK